jgi:hypothetical protein
MVDNVTMETKVRSLPLLNNATDTVLLNNVREVDILRSSFQKLSIFQYIYFVTTKQWSRVSSASIVSDYGLDDRAIGVRSPAEAKDFSSSLCVQTGSGAHPASCTMGTGGLSPGVKRGRVRDADYSPLSSAEVVNV